MGYPAQEHPHKTDLYPLSSNREPIESCRVNPSAGPGRDDSRKTDLADLGDMDRQPCAVSLVNIKTGDPELHDRNRHKRSIKDYFHSEVARLFLPWF